jgi:L-amino acid N-acyltransferase YncA
MNREPGKRGTGTEIRLATVRDAAQISEVYAPIVRDTIISFEVEPPAEHEIRRRIEGTLERFPWLVCERHGRLAGYAFAAGHSARAAYQRRTGVGRALYCSLFAILALQGFYNAYAGIALPNPASVSLHEALGFRPVGIYRGVGYKLGAWHDVGWWQLSLQERPASPKPPADLSTVQRSKGWQTALARGLISESR